MLSDFAGLVQTLPGSVDEGLPCPLCREDDLFVFRDPHTGEVETVCFGCTRYYVPELWTPDDDADPDDTDTVPAVPLEPFTPDEPVVAFGEA